MLSSTTRSKVIQCFCGFHHHVANNGSWEHLVRNPMISGVNTLLKDAIIALSLGNMFLSIGKIGHEGPSIILEYLEHWLEFIISADCCDLKGGPLIQFYYRFNQRCSCRSSVICNPHCGVILTILGYCSYERHAIDVHYVSIEAYMMLGINS